MKQEKQQIHKCSKKQKRTARTAISCLMLLLLYGCAYHNEPAVTVVSDEAESNENDVQKDADGSRIPSDQESIMIAVYVCGAVKDPGVYELETGSRVYEALALAGGLTAEAASTAVNQAELLTDGQMIVIPTEKEAQEKADEERSRADGLVNINTADLEELQTLPGIGESKARSIIAYREKNGAFQTIGDIKNIEGIKDGVFAKLEGCIKVE